MNLTLHEISDTYKHALESLNDDELPAEAVRDTLEGLTGDLTVKATNVAKFVQNLEGLADQIKLAEQAMAHRRKVLENRAESIRAYIKDCMETAGMTKIECPFFKLSIKKNPQAVEIINEFDIPGEYKRFIPPPPPVPDKKLIAAAIDEGKEVPGARVIQRTRLEIK